jgi:cell division protein FtsX
MLYTIFRTTWHHIVRTKYIPFLVIGAFTLLSVTADIGYSMMQLLSEQRVLLGQKFTYPLFINNSYTFQSPRIEAFVQSLTGAGISGNIQYVSRQEALDQEVQKNPDILSVLHGENPLPDMIMVPIYGADITVLWSRIQEFRDIFDSVQSFETLRSRLKKLETSLKDIDHIVQVLIIFISLSALIALLLVFMMMRYQAKLFSHEQIIGRLVGAHPIFFW